MPGRLLFVCAQEPSRALLASNLLHARAVDRLEVWSTPTADQHGYALAEQVLREQGITPLPAEQLILPTSGMAWEEPNILCRGAADTWPFIPSAGRRRLWSLEDPPSQTLEASEQLASYRRIRDVLARTIRRELLLPARLAVLPQHK